jgi:hypothetical protein
MFTSGKITYEVGGYLEATRTAGSPRCTAW